MASSPAPVASRNSQPSSSGRAGSLAQTRRGLVRRGLVPTYSPLSALQLLRSIPMGLWAPGAALADLCKVVEEQTGGSVTLFESGTQALQSALSSLTPSNEGPRPRVALPAYGCFDLAAAAVGANVDMLFYDIDTTTLCPDLDDLDRVLFEGVDGVVVAPQFGLLPNWDDLKSRIKTQGSLLIEDVAQSHGSTWKNEDIGSIGDLAILSFGRGKGWTGAGGGALIVGAANARAGSHLLPAGWTAGMKRVVIGSAMSLLSHPHLFRHLQAFPGLGIGDTTYHSPSEPREFSPLGAATALATRSASLREAVVRKENAERFRQALAASSVLSLFRETPGADPGYLRRPIRIHQPILPSVWSALHGLGVRKAYPRVLPTLAEVRSRRLCWDRSFPGAEELVASLVTLPTHSRLGEADIEAIIRLLLKGLP